MKVIKVNPDWWILKCEGAVFFGTSENIVRRKHAFYLAAQFAKRTEQIGKRRFEVVNGGRQVKLYG